ncbi:MAG: aldo/keto reductase, partial [Chloroflexi bacterium]|nr:aldo/keto reductase [Chloroflexota bacterium]
TGLHATICGLGSGGFSRLGAAQDKGNENAEHVVRAAIDAGINLIDTAEGYGTETVIGNAISRAGGHVDRDRLILSTKFSYKIQERLKTPAEIEISLDNSLQCLRTDHIDIYHVHGVRVDDYPHVVKSFLPVLQRLRERGKIRHIGITEAFSTDTAHKTLSRAVQDDGWDVVMVGHNLLNPSARERVLNVTRAKGIGVLCMFAVRQALIRIDQLESYLQHQVQRGNADAHVLQAVPLVRQLLESGQCQSLTEAAYRFCRAEPGIDCVLSGTGSAEHLQQNIADLQKPPLPAAFLSAFEPLFAELSTLSGQ